jgi:hypothetical protein
LFADPQSVTINAVAQTLPRVGSPDASKGVYLKDDGNVRLEISHTTGRRNRDVMRLTHRKIAADPLVGSVNIQYSLSVTLTVDKPTVGYSVAEAKQIVDALTAYLTASSGARATQLLGGEI